MRVIVATQPRSQETRTAAWRVYESLTRAGEYVHFRRFGACALNLKAP
jgi:hypothetical protein